jgi:hypothetical protein
MAKNQVFGSFEKGKLVKETNMSFPENATKLKINNDILNKFCCKCFVTSSL